ncbi:MAG: N-acetyltransferase family protein [Rhizomicrobium sp.]
MSRIVVRRMSEADLPVILAIYNHYIENTPTTFDLEPQTLELRRHWFAKIGPSGRYQAFVAERDGVVVGWANTSPFRTKAAYETTVETTIYLAPDAMGLGLGRMLYRTLLEAISREDVHRAYGVVTMPNDASVALHVAMGFKLIGEMKEVGRKFDRFWDVAWFERAISPKMFAEPPTQAP